jgi:hypothetical protein
MRTGLQQKSVSSKPGALSTNNLGNSSIVNILEESILSTNIKSSKALSTQDIVMSIVPIAAVFVIIFGFGIGAWSLRKHICAFKQSKNKDVS